MKRHRFTHSIPIILLLGAAAALYLHHITRDVYSGDIGDLVTAAFVGGVAHPPGYPLFTMLGHFLSSIPVPLPVVSRIALVSVGSAVAALALYYAFARSVVRNKWLAILSTSVLAFSYLFWFHAEIPEVFGLIIFFVFAILYLAVRFYRKPNDSDLRLLAFTIGLSLTHHHTILLIFPAVALLVLRHVKYLFAGWKCIPAALLCLAAGLIVYLYVPIAASHNPVINWDDARTFPNFMRLLTRKDYGGFAPSVDNGVAVQVKLIFVRDYFSTLARIYSYQIVFVAAVGVIGLFLADKWLLAALLTAFIVSGPFFVFYATTYITSASAWGVIERFYALSSMVFMFAVPYGFRQLKEWFYRFLPRKIYAAALLAYFAIIPVYMIIYNFPRTDLSRTRIGTNLGLDVLNDVPTKSILYVDGDTKIFNVWYARYVLGARRDVDLMNPPGVGENTYLNDRINDYYRRHPKAKLSEILWKTLEEIRGSRPIYSTYQIDFVPADSILVPRGMSYELMKRDAVPAKEAYIIQVEARLHALHIARRETLAPAENNLVTPEIPLIYSNSLVHIGDFVDSYYMDPGTAQQYYRRALWIDPDNPSGYAGLALTQYKADRDCSQSIENMKAAIELYPIWKTYYEQLYILYRRCGTADPAVRKLRDFYKKQFHTDIDRVVGKSVTE